MRRVSVSREKSNRNPSIQGKIAQIHQIQGDVEVAIQGMSAKVSQLETLMEFSALLNSQLDPVAVREKALVATCRLVGCETASLLLVDRKRMELYWDSALGDAASQLKSIRLPINAQSIAGSVAMNGEAEVINDVSIDSRHNKKVASLSGLKTKSMICIPLKARGKLVAVMQAINKMQGEFSVEDLRVFETLGAQVAIAIDNSRLYIRLKKNFYDTVEALAESIEKKDRYTGGHTKRVVHYSMCIAENMNLDEETLENVRLGALLHDVGKIGIEDSILKKQAPLSPEEWKVMQKHPELGYDIMSRVESLQDVVAGMRFHHERYDGHGYPLGLKGQEIPLIARIIAVADTYDAMVSTRPYRKGLDPQFARAEIARYRGSQFDPQVVDAFLKAFDEAGQGKGLKRLPQT